MCTAGKILILRLRSQGLVYSVFEFRANVLLGSFDAIPGIGFLSASADVSLSPARAVSE